MADFERDIICKAEHWARQPGRDDVLPIMNFRTKRPPGVEPGAYQPPPPQLSCAHNLIEYAVTVWCQCGFGTHLMGGNVAALVAKANRASFDHVLTTLTCRGCGGQPYKLEIMREADRGLGSPPMQIIEAPMCGRYTFTKSVDEVRGLFGFANTPNLEPRYNIAPSQMVPAVAAIGDERKLGMMQWGLIPSWAKDTKIGFSNINARLDTIATKPAFRSAFKARHCLILADGFYEWEAEGKPKQPWRFTLPDGGAFAFAGIWEKWKNPAGDTITSCALITREPFREVAPVHNRSPVILAPEAYADWLNCNHSNDSGDIGVKDYSGPLRAYKVSPALNNAKNNDHPGLIEPMDVRP